jgi:hypothetical protein
VLPAAPANSVTLAQVLVSASVVSIVNANITNLRPNTATIGGTIICTSATHPVAPVIGQKIFETDTGAELTYQSVATGFTPPWNTAWGVTATAVVNTNQTVSTAAFADVAGLTVTFGATTNRLYETTVDVGYAQQNVAANASQVAICNAANTVLDLQGAFVVANGIWAYHAKALSAGLTGSQTLKARALVSANTLTLGGATSTMRITTRDVGPNGAPA